MSPPRLMSPRTDAPSRLVDCALRLLLVSAFVLCGSHAASVASPGRPRVVLILVDGVRWDYLSEPDLPGFGELAKTGVKAEYVVPIMPANSYPNWYTIVTGLYGERHGFVQNYMYDDQYDDFFMMAPHPNASNPHWWNHAEPVWVTAEKNGLRTGMYYWDGCQVEIRGVKPTICFPYRNFGKWPTAERDTKAALSEAVRKLKQNALDFALVYYEAVDAAGHVYGPDSKERKEALKSADYLLKHLLDEARKHNIRDQFSIIVVSDHGMTDTSLDKNELIDIETHIDASDIHCMLDGGAFSMLRPHRDKIDKLRLTESEKQMPKSNRTVGGGHGYDPMKLADMRAIFLATGPGLKQGFQNEPVRMVDHYNVICRQLGIKPLENSGRLDIVQGMFVGGASGSSTAVSLSLLVVPNILLAARSYLYH